MWVGTQRTDGAGLRSRGREPGLPPENGRADVQHAPVSLLTRFIDSLASRVTAGPSVRLEPHLSLFTMVPLVIPSMPSLLPSPTPRIAPMPSAPLPPRASAVPSPRSGGVCRHYTARFVAVLPIAFEEQRIQLTSACMHGATAQRGQAVASVGHAPPRAQSISHATSSSLLWYSSVKFVLG